VSAAQLRDNFSRQLHAGHDQAALVVAHTLTQRFPRSPEAQAVSAQLPEIEARVASQKAAAAEAATRAAQQARIKSVERLKLLLGRMSREYDSVEHTTFIQPRANSLAAGPKTYVTLYVGRADSGDTWLRTRLQYGGERWIFFDRIKVNIDGVTLPEEKLGYFRVERDNQDGYVWEWADLSVPDAAVPVFEAMAAGKSVVVRFEGKYRKDLVLSSAAKQTLRDTLEMYSLMKAGFSP